MQEERILPLCWLLRYCVSMIKSPQRKTTRTSAIQRIERKNYSYPYDYYDNYDYYYYSYNYSYNYSYHHFLFFYYYHY
jgi:hypothetical protein